MSTQTRVNYINDLTSKAIKTFSDETMFTPTGEYVIFDNVKYRVIRVERSLNERNVEYRTESGGGSYTILDKVINIYVSQPIK